MRAPEGTPGSSAGPTLTFTEIRGLTPEQTGITFVPAQERIEECRKSTGGKIVVRLRTENGRVVPDLLPGSSLNPFQQRCVLESLSQTQVPDTANTANGPYIRPTGFTAILTVEW